MTVYRSLNSLLAAFGITSYASKTFNVNVPGAGPGMDVLGYILESWDNWQSSDAAGAHVSGALIHFTFDMHGTTQWASYLRIASPTGMAAYFDIAADPGTAGAVITAGTWGAAMSGNAITVQLNGRQKFGSYSGGSGTLTVVRNYYKFYTAPDQPLGSADEEYEILVSMNVGTYSSPALTQELFDLVFEYPATQLHSSGLSYNAMLQYRTTVTVAGYDAGPPPNDIPMLEWHGNSSFTNLLSTDPDYTFLVNAGNSQGDVWLRSRLHTTDPWINYPSNPVHWHDIRYP